MIDDQKPERKATLLEKIMILFEYPRCPDHEIRMETSYTVARTSVASSMYRTLVREEIVFGCPMCDYTACIPLGEKIIERPQNQGW